MFTMFAMYLFFLFCELFYSCTLLHFLKIFLLFKNTVLAGVAQRIGCWPANWEGCQFDSLSFTHWCFSPLSPSLPLSLKINYKNLKKKKSPGWFGSMDWAPNWEAKGHRFDSQSGHMPRLQARSPAGGLKGATTPWCFSPPLSLSLPSL